MRVLAIDPGTATVGFGVVDFIKGKLIPVEYGVIQTHKANKMPQRLAEIYDQLDTLIKLYNPDSVAVEDLFFFSNQKTVISVGQARGVILLCIAKNGKESYSYTPMQVKQGVAAYGKATKEQIQEMVKKLLGLVDIPKPDDAADALALAITHIYSMKNQLSTIPKGRSVSEIPKNFDKNKISIEEYRGLIKK